MTNPTPDHLAVVQAALARKSACRCRLVGPADFEMCDGCDRLSLALRNAAPAIAALADECAAARDRIATLEAELVQARAHQCGGIVLGAEDADRIAALLEDPPAPTPAMVALFAKAKE